MRFLQNFLKISQIFRENLRKNQNYAVVGGSEGQSPPDAGKICKNIYKKANEKLQFRAIFQNFNENYAIFT